MWTTIKKINSADKNVSKFVFEKEDAVAEAVLYKYPTYEERTVICCSTQSGCPIGCRFCGAGDNFVRSLNSTEILDQVVDLLVETGCNPVAIKKLQIMFMSMGEPLLNLKNLSVAMRRLHGVWPAASLLISTSAPEVDYAPLRAISKEIPTIGLQFSVHESTDEARNTLIPFKKKLTLSQISDEGKQWYEATGRQPFFNYCVHEKNNSAKDVERLTNLFDPSFWQCTLSVICERSENVAAANERQRELVTDLSNKMLGEGHSTRVFNPAGQDDIGGGCGQLWHVQKWMRDNKKKTKPSEGRGLPVVHCPT